MTENLALQISPRVSSPVNPVLDYYEEVWGRTRGYLRPFPDLLELPEWTARLNHDLEGDLDFLLVNKETDLSVLANYRHVYGSVLDVNLKHWKAYVNFFPQVFFILGGYTKPIKADNVVWKNTLEEVSDYSIFAGKSCIPRLALSSGCLHDCKFCTIPRKVSAIPRKTIFRNVRSFQPLHFELIYIDDKTFGQSENWKLLKEISKEVLKYNPGFLGFIIQTTATETMRHAQSWIEDYNVKYIEIGVESLDARTLASWRKPHSVKQIRRASETLRAYGKCFIPNLIFGIQGDDKGEHDYSASLEYLQEFKDCIPFFNPYFLCQYHDSKGNGDGSIEHAQDSNENTSEKSWLTREEQAKASRALDAALKIFRVEDLPRNTRDTYKEDLP